MLLIPRESVCSFSNVRSPSAAEAYPVIAHVACPTTEESRRLAAHAASAGADAVAALPPFFYKVSDRENAEYWKAISAAAPGVDFFIYDIPELSANRLTDALLREMAQCEDLAGVKASSETAGM